MDLNRVLGILENDKNVELKEKLSIVTILRKNFEEKKYEDVNDLLLIIDFYKHKSVIYLVTVLSTCFPARNKLTNYDIFRNKLNDFLFSLNLPSDEILRGL